MTGTIGENATYYATVEHDNHPEEIACVCDSCTWRGPASDLNEINDAVLTPGHESPAGRCPDCAALAYVDKPGASELADLVRSLLGCAELNQDDLEPNTVTVIELANAMLKDLP